MKKLIVFTVAIVLMLAFIIGAQASHKVGDIIQFADMDWRVLEVRDSRALIIMENILIRRPYNEQLTSVTWETSSLRRYLNSEFLQNFTTSERERIEETRIFNSDNLWYGTSGGINTIDKIFLISLEEVDRYFGNSGDYENKRRKNYEGQWPSGRWASDDNGMSLTNANDNDRIAKNDENRCWWLRSPGRSSSFAALVVSGGSVSVNGYPVDGYVSLDHVGVRPALWLIF